MNAADEPPDGDDGPEEQAVEFLIAHERALEDGSPPPEPPESLLRRLGPHRSGVALLFGAKLDPFAAHCWVQSSDLVLNDRIETRAIKLCFKEHACRIPMSATKSMVGHPQGASGASGISAALFAMKEGMIPPTLNLENADPECDLDYVPCVPRKARVRYALANCIGFGSKNSAVVLGSA